MSGIIQVRWTDAQGHMTYTWADHGSESIPVFVGRGLRHARYGHHEAGMEDEVFIEGWIAIDEQRKTLLLGLDYWSLDYPALGADHEPILRTLAACGCDPENVEGRQWLTAWLRAAWPGWTVGIATDRSEPVAALLRGEPLSTIPVHEDPPHPAAATGCREWTESFRRIADAFAAGFYIWGAGEFDAPAIVPIKEIVRRLGVDRWEPRAVHSA